MKRNDRPGADRPDVSTAGDELQGVGGNSRLVVYGDIAVDLLMQTGQLPVAGGDSEVRDYEIRPGGSAANCAIVAAGLGTPTTFLGFVGSDPFGNQLVDLLVNRGEASALGATFDHLTVLEGKTGFTLSLIDPTGERTFLSYRGVNATGTAADLPTDPGRTGTHLHLTGYSFQDGVSRENANLLLEIAESAGLEVSLDPSHIFARDFRRRYRDVLKRTSVLLPNREEAILMSGRDDLEYAAQKLLESGPEAVIVKLGAAGCMIATRDSGPVRCVPALDPGRVVDTTGAGDAFSGGFLTGRIAGLSFHDSIAPALAAASVVVGSAGATTGAPTRAHLRDVLIRNGFGAVARQLKRQREL
ncbi:MAG: carbohydrate kinase family protein [Spirochaetaceae bacterium]|nr:MAG: carbohydrate kinase family protein [Spirochaetaceae bacterium]